MRASEPQRTTKFFVVLGVVCAVAVLFAESALADHAHIEISVPVDSVVDAPENSTIELTTAPVPEGFTDHSCEVEARSQNQASIHPDNDLLIESGNSQVLLPNVEAEPGQVVAANEMLVLGDVITVSLIMGPDGLFSGGIDVVVECFAADTATTTTEEATTTTAQATTTTAQVSPTQESTTTTAVSDTTASSMSPTSTTIEDEVLGTEVLPFTGVSASEIGLVGLALLAVGVLLVAPFRKADD